MLRSVGPIVPKVWNAPAACVWICSILIASPAPALAPSPLGGRADTEERARKLEAFFLAHGCPQPFHVEDYLQAADLNGLDYRILPAVSVLETTCGVYAYRNNRWGWASARVGFLSVAHGIRYIAQQLAWGRYYRGKDVDEKLLVYNPNRQYVRDVKHLMLEIDGD
jgi:hypothetical protein